MENNINIAGNITRLRKKKGETQIQLADAIGVSNKTISKWEAGDSEPELKYVMTLAEHFEVTADSLIGGESDGNGGSSQPVEFRDAAVRFFHDVTDRTFAFREGIVSYDAKTPREPLIPGIRVRWKEDEANRTWVLTPEIFTQAHSSAENNLLITLMQNEDNFGWLDRDCGRLCEIFALLTEPGVLPLVKYVHTDGTPAWLSAEYAAEQTGCSVESARALFELMNYSKDTVEFEEGKRAIYLIGGNGYLLSALAAIYEGFLDKNYSQTRSMNAVYKPISGRGKE